MNHTEIDNLFHTLQLETEEQRSAMRFEPFNLEEHLPVHVFHSGSTCQVSTPEEPEKIA